VTQDVETAEAAEVEDFSELLGEENCVHLHGNLYRVRRECIEYAEPGITVENGGVKFGNPRWVKNSKGKPVARGLETAKMNRLKDSIQKEGLENPLRLRVLDDEDGESITLQLVNGERRFRSIDLLAKDQTECVDPATGKTLPADELFEWVDCRINRMSDLDAIRMSLRPNETGESIGEVAAMEVVRAMRETDADDEEIMRVTGMSITWLRETDRLLKLDEDTRTALQTDNINRKLALKLATIKDTNERIARLEKCCQSAVERLAEREAALNEGAENDQAEAEINEAAAALAQAEGDGDEAEQAKKKAAAAKKRADKKREEAERLEEQGPQATSKDWDDTNSENDPPKPLTTAKIEKAWRGPLGAAIRKKGLDEDGNEPEYDLEDARLMKTIVDAICDGKRESDNKTPISFEKLLKQHAKAKARRNS
jgi:hypothetical protein